MKKIVFISMLFVVTSNSYSQEDSIVNTKIQAIVKGFSTNSARFTSMDSVPRFVINYIEKRNGAKFSISNRKFNATDNGSGPRRKLSFIAKLKDDYILSYQHGGMGYHCHSIIFETNGSEVINVYNIITYDNVKKVAELMDIVESKRYWLREEHL
jgi:hypothetical protein